MTHNLLRKTLLPLHRSLCCGSTRFSSSNNVEVSIKEDTGIATLTLAQPPVNSLSGEFLANISSNMKKLAKDPSVKGLLITSKFHDKVFSAGLNIPEMYNQSDENLGEFWRAVQEWYLDTFSFPKPVVAAINGHAPAGGCAMSLMCDYRIMMSGKTIGLNETQLGISAPFFFVDLMTTAIGVRQSELALAEGKLFSSEDALNVGLIDEIADPDDLIPKSIAKLQQLVNIPQPAFSITKNYFRGPNVKILRETREQDIASFVGLLQQPIVQTVLGNYLHRLKNRKK